MKNHPWALIIGNIRDFEFRKGLTSFINPYSLLTLKDEIEIATSIDFWCVDGISLVKVINRLKKSNIYRTSFDDSSIAPSVFEFVKKNSLSIAVIGTKDEYLKKAIQIIEKKYAIKVDYSHSGYFIDEEERNDSIYTILKKKIDVVICGMGTPLQELFIIDLKKIGWLGYGFTCGGYLHQISRKENYYPAFFNKLNIRWVYRIIDEPKLLRRYTIDYPVFFFQFINWRKKYFK